MHWIYFAKLLLFAFLLKTCKAEEWRPVTRRPTHEYVAPTMDRVHYWQRRPSTSSMEYQQPPPLRITNSNGAFRHHPVPPFMLLPPSLKDSSYIHLWSARDEPSSNDVDDTPWHVKETTNPQSSSSFHNNVVINNLPSPPPPSPPSPSQQPPPMPQMMTTPPTTTTTTQATTTSTEDPTVNLVEPLQLIIEGHSKVRKYGVTYLPFELAQHPIFKKPEKITDNPLAES